MQCRWSTLNLILFRVMWKNVFKMNSSIVKVGVWGLMIFTALYNIHCRITIHQPDCHCIENKTLSRVLYLARRWRPATFHDDFRMIKFYLLPICWQSMEEVAFHFISSNLNLWYECMTSFESVMCKNLPNIVTIATNGKSSSFTFFSIGILLLSVPTVTVVPPGQFQRSIY